MPRVRVTAAGEDLPRPGPVADRAARHPARSDHEVGGRQRREQRGQLGRIVRSVGVHLHERAVAAIQRPAEAGQVGGAEPGLLRPVQHLNVLVGQRELVRQVAGAVRAVVVDDQQIRVGHGRPNSGHDVFEVLPLVVRRDHHGDRADRSPLRAAGRISRSPSNLPPSAARTRRATASPMRPTPASASGSSATCRPRSRARPARLAHHNSAGAPPRLPNSLPGRGPGKSLRTGVRPVGSGLALRCLLGAQAPPGSNPPPSQGSGLSRIARSRLGGHLTAQPTARLTSLTCWPGAGLRRNLPPIGAMSTCPARTDTR